MVIGKSISHSVTQSASQPVWALPLSFLHNDSTLFVINLLFSPLLFSSLPSSSSFSSSSLLLFPLPFFFFFSYLLLSSPFFSFSYLFTSHPSSIPLLSFRHINEWCPSISTSYRKWMAVALRSDTSPVCAAASRESIPFRVSAVRTFS